MTPAQLIADALKVAPPVMVCSAPVLFGIELDNWVKFATLAFIVFQVGMSILRYRRNLAPGHE